ncbi:hypothetical protein Bbelb_376790 [Branchiostoma belcheri]|nr:hypothetical protein Bbelb_376790 [Branchiostoma belcheri]
MLNIQNKGLTLNVEGVNPANNKAIAEVVNRALCQVTTSLPPLNPSLLPTFLPAQPMPEINPWEMYSKLKNVQARKAAGPDGVPGRIIKEFACEWSIPMTAILNSSVAEGHVPTQWRRANVVPLPKTNPPVLNELRPVSLTPILAKFGCVAGKSTTHCLVDIVHHLSKTSDRPSTVSTLILTDFAKAFDRVEHTLTVSSLLNLGLRPALARWIISFLSDRKQRRTYSQSTQATSDQCVSTQYQRGIHALHKHNVTSWRESNAVPSEPSLAKTTLTMLTPVSYLASRLWDDGETTSA